MGAYLSEPITEKESSDAESAAGAGSVAHRAAASAMQGWRVNQEDAHNTILEFDGETSLFAVYDGHGGAEVAAYCARNLPDYIKQTEAYGRGELARALEDAFLGFDATITTQEVLNVLKEYAGTMNPPQAVEGDSEAESEPDDIGRLCSEAEQPLGEVLARYESGGGERRSRHAHLAPELAHAPHSPFLRAKMSKEHAAEGAPGSGGGASSSGSEPSASSTSLPEDHTTAVSSTCAGDSLHKHKGPTKEEVSTSETSDCVPKTDEKAEKEKEGALLPDSSEDTHEKPEQSGESGGGGGGGAEPEPGACNGDVTESKSGEDIITSSRNGDIKAKGKKLMPSSLQAAAASDCKRMKAEMRRAAASLLQHAMRACGRDGAGEEGEEGESGEESDDEEEDETFVGGAEQDSSDEDAAADDGAAHSDSSEGEEEDSDEAEDEEESYRELTEEPGQDSGCTAVVALLRGSELYVGNAGDSRCVVCREGRALDMSVDHKPEDAPELRRITAAGGKVSSDGRINGGLNLSRAIGDHSYKQNKELDARQQMITALPDVRTHTVDPHRDQFMILACDGIWNFMSSQDVCDFIAPRLREGRERLSQICEEMFDHCLAPSSLGDGTGCDNMTAVLVTFKKGPGGAAEVSAVSTSEWPKKRAAEEEEPPSGDARLAKRRKPDRSSPDVTSSV